MAQYQSFPEIGGDSLSLDKLKALNLPDLSGRRFLDVGCNEGFFCGFAKFQGAERVVGIDHSALFIERARRRFPECEFYRQDWQEIPAGVFDVILLASSLHYAEDQAELIRRLVERLSPDGVLVLELGIVQLMKNDWVKVERGIDERLFPTMAKLRETLEPYAWKWIGESVLQAGDPVPRHVVHVSRRRPFAYLLLQPPGYGKSTIAKSLFLPAGVAAVSGDELILQVATGRKEAPASLQALLAEDFSPFRIDQTIRKVFEAGLGPDLVALFRREADGADFALDVYIPDEHHALVESLLSQAGYLPVTMRWGKAGMSPMPQEVSARRAEGYFLALVESGHGEAGLPADAPATRVPAQGFIDEAVLSDDLLTIRGWAVSETGEAPRVLSVRVGGQAHLISAFERQARADVQDYLGLPHALFGYRVSLAVPSGAGAEKLLETLELRAGSAENSMGPVLAFATPLAKSGRG
ncbi:class I SAM-dependent methyltransferase [Luteimonas aquatica]|uniref:class I SAM-dependent methyltransferase n=1 Tax=Luteimonas aquatica TaxID=450364 RepID=UPI001F55B07B|nr:class I SAM-dependent methyltransferase [Luteimonas aquatica]